MFLKLFTEYIGSHMNVIYKLKKQKKRNLQCNKLTFQLLYYYILNKPSTYMEYTCLPILNY